MKPLLKIAAISALAYLVGCAKTDTFDLFLYPNRNDLTVSQRGGEFSVCGGWGYAFCPLVIAAACYVL